MASVIGHGYVSPDTGLPNPFNAPVVPVNNNNQASSEFGALAAGLAKASGSDASLLGEILRQSNDIASRNSALSQAYAREQMDYQDESGRYAMNWSAQEAEKNREWQERLSNTAHQREVADLVAAGLNPILSANHGAVTGSGATGQAFQSSGAMGNVDMTNPINMMQGFFTDMLNSALQIKMHTDNMDLAKAQMETQSRIANTQAEASMFNARTSAGAQIYSANQANEASHYTSDTNKFIHAMDNEYAKAEAKREREFQHEENEADRYTSVYNNERGLLKSFTGAIMTMGEGMAQALGANLDVYKRNRYDYTGIK